MNSEYERVHLKSIDLTDTTFVVSYGFSLCPLKESIEKIGVINPPLVLKKNNGRYQIVCGYKRLLACHDIGIKETVCAVIGGQIEEKDVFSISLHDNLSHREFNLIEKSRAISILQNHFPDETIVKSFLPVLGLPPHFKALERMKKIACLKEEMMDAVADGRLDERASLKLLQFSEKERGSLFQLLISLRLSRNKQNEVIDHIFDILKRDGQSVSTLLNSQEVKDILGNENLNTPQKGVRVRHVLKKWRYPRIAKAEEEFLEMQRTLDLGENIQLIHPRFFEDEKYTLTLQFGSMDELEKNLIKVASIQDNTEFQKAIED